MKTSKRDILTTLAKTFDFELVKKKFPDVDDEEIKETLLEASLFFKKEQEKEAQITLPQANTPVIIHTDGASKGNPGLAGAGIVISGVDGKVIKKIKRFLGVMTNNQAEYNALLIALKEAHNLKYGSVKIFMDSELIVKQIRGEYRVKNEELKAIYDEVNKQLKKFEKYDINHVMRSKNFAADTLANEAISEHKSSERNR